LGWDGADFRAILVDATGKLLLGAGGLPGKTAFGNVLLGYDSVYTESGIDLNALAGVNTKTLAAVPAGHLAIIENMWALNANTNVRIIIGYTLGGTAHVFRDVPAAGVGIYATENTIHTLPPGAQLTFVFIGCTLNDDIAWGASGYFCSTV
jgi:hypothetical protein